MKIRKINISKYKVFDNIDIDFTDKEGKTLDIIVFAGLNGCGKTTLLELIKDIFSGKTIEEIPEDFQFSIELDFTEIPFVQDFFEKIEANKKQFDSTIKINNTYLRLEYTPKKSKKKNGIQTFSRLMSIFAECQKEFKYKTKIVYRYSHDRVKAKHSKEGNDLVLEVSFNTHKNDMKNLIMKPIYNQIFKNKDIAPKQIIENEINQVTHVFEDMNMNSRFVDIESEELVFESLNKQRIKFEDLSSGEKFLYFMGFYLLKININKSLIIVDEPEESLHPTWQKQITGFYSRLGQNNQVILATHSPHIIGSVPSKNVFLLKSENNTIAISQPKYSKGHSIPYILSEIMDTDYRNTYINNLVNKYITLISKGLHETLEGKEIYEEIEKLDPNSEERQLVNLNLRRFRAIGK